MTPSHVLTTERLALRIAAPEDAAFIHALWTTPEVMRFVGFPQGLAMTVDAVRQQLLEGPAAAFGSRLIAECRESGERIAQCKIGIPDEHGICEPDIKLHPDQWGKGYGTELWTAMIDYAFEHSSAAIVQGTPSRDNVASVRMQTRAGMTVVDEGVFEANTRLHPDATPVPFFKMHITRDDWRARQVQYTGSQGGSVPHSDEVREAWEKNARWWSDYFGEGNDFHLTLIAPAVETLLQVKPGERLLDIACGNGAFSRRMADLGAHVVGFDFSAPFVECAIERSADYGERTQYHVVDATDRQQMLALGGGFDGAVANMALMDMSDIEPLAECLPTLLKPGGRFVLSIMHPCFNNNAVRLSIEDEQCGADFVAVPSVRVTRYLTPFASKGIGIVGQPVHQTYFHRPLGELLRPFMAQGMWLTGLEEKAFKDASAASRSLSWDHFAEIPPVLVARLQNGQEVGTPLPLKEEE